MIRQIDDPTNLGHAVDEFLADRHPTLLGLGEPTHGVAAFPLLRNELFAHLVERGFRSIALETDLISAIKVDDYIAGSADDLDEVLTTGFSHGFGGVPGNRELVEWLRTYNTGKGPEDRVHFYGFDAPVEYASAPSPRRYMPGTPESLFGDDADWTNPNAMYDASASIGRSDRARALHAIAESLTPSAHARTALGLLRYHETMATPGPDRIDRLLAVRAEMMAENLLAIVADELHRGPTLVFAHNAHLLRSGSWANAGALAAEALGDRYVVIAADGRPRSAPGTLQGLLADATTRRALFTSPSLPPSIEADEPMIPGHIPLTPSDVGAADAVIFVTDTDGVRHQYW